MLNIKHIDIDQLDATVGAARPVISASTDSNETSTMHNVVLDHRVAQVPKRIEVIRSKSAQHVKHIKVI
jgi:hypothetical protein